MSKLILLALFSGEAKAPPMWFQGESNWGTVEVVGRVIHIRGDACWEATGYVRADGKLYLLWEALDTKRKAHSLYVLKSPSVIAGQWAYVDECQMRENGELRGARLRSDYIVLKELP